MHCVDLGENFPTSLHLQRLASIQPRTSLAKFARSSSAALSPTAAALTREVAELVEELAIIQDTAIVPPFAAAAAGLSLIHI